MSEEAKGNPIVVSIINLKGGVGKTTVAALLARYAARMNLNVLAVDLDPQANLSQALMTENDYKLFMENGEPSVVELFNGYLPPFHERSAPAPLEQVARKVGDYENFHLVPSRFDFSDNLISSVRVDERVLARYIAHEMGDKDLILIDCAPTESVLTRTAYQASRYVLVPVKTEFFSTIGFPLLAPAPLEQVARKVGDYENFHLVPSRFDFSDNLISSVRVDERVLARYIAHEMGDKDLILIDCAPTESVLTRTAYQASRYVLVPVKTEFFSTIGFPLLKESLEKFRLDNPTHAIDVCGVLINNTRTSGSRRGPHHESAISDIYDKANDYGWPIMENQMFHSDGFPKLMSGDYNRLGHAPYESRTIANEFLEMMDLSPKEE